MNLQFIEYTKILGFLNDSLSKCASIFADFVKGHWLSIFLSVFVITVVFRTIIRPLLGASGSDGVLNRKEEDNEDQLLHGGR